MLYNFKGSGIILPQTVLTTARRVTVAKPQIVESYLKAFIESIAYMLDPPNKSTVIRIIATNLRLDNPADAEESYQTIVNSYERVPSLNLDGMKKLHGILTSINPKLASVRSESVVDTSSSRNSKPRDSYKASPKIVRSNANRKNRISLSLAAVALHLKRRLLPNKQAPPRSSC
jgi:hypothetical protein